MSTDQDPESMAKPKTVYVCQQCAAESLQWQGRCVDCGAWDSLVEQRTVAGTPSGTGRGPVPVRLVELGSDAPARASTGIGELDRVLGGGLVPGSVTLLGGDPGIGKSTLLLQVAALIAGDQSVLYASGEESGHQVALRAARLGLGDRPVAFLAETDLGAILDAAATAKPAVLVVDSIQTVMSQSLTSAAGSVSQLRECAGALVRLAKSSGCAVFIVGHVTKEGVIAGPRVLEHMVDTVLYFQSEATSRYRLLRAVKNRFGAANEIGVFAMVEEGLREVKNPSAIFLAGHDAAVVGSAVTVFREGSRPLLVELQALVDGCVGAHPRRVTVGLDANRLAMLIAVLHRHAGIALGSEDVFVNAVGGVRVSETGSDLPVIAAAVSSYRDRPLSPKQVIFGEVGLVGEIRPVPFGEERLREAAKHGIERAVVPRANMPSRPIDGLEVVGVDRLDRALDAIFD
jgi:DNA repair protein RadA/Sms